MVDEEAIIIRRKELGWSQTKLAEAASAVHGSKIVQQAIDRIEKGGSSKYKIAVMQALGVLPNGTTAPSLPTSRRAPEIEVDESAPSFRSQAGRGRDVPELGIAVGGSEGDFSLNGETIAYVQRPTALVGRDVFAIRVRNDSMEPRYEEGDLVYVDRRREPRPGDYTIVELHPDEEGAAGAAFIKRLVSKNMHSVIVRQFNPDTEITFERARVKALYRVFPHNELLGV